MNREEIDFANEDLGLAPVHGEDIEGDDFDAFNEDTFGAEDAWVEDDHEELAKYTEEERRAVQDGDSFFDFDNDKSTQNGRKESPRMFSLADDINDNLKLGTAPPAQHSHMPHMADPAIMNVMRFPPMPNFPPPGVHPIPTHVTQFSTGLNDPAIMSLGQIPPQHLLLLQQQQLLQHQMMRQPPPLQQQPPMLQARTVEELERQILADQDKREERQHQMQQQARLQHHLQQQQQQHQHHHYQQQQQQRHQQYHHQHQQQLHQHSHQYQQQQRANMNQGRAQNQRNRNPFDDKNRETFGDAFVEHHHHHHAQHHRQHDNLITPGHVHVLGILRGARERRGHVNQGPAIAHESTGNPMRDRELQRLAESRRFGLDGSARADPDDEYAGLMNQRERQWIVNIQLSQLKCENPFLDDYYFTVFNLQKQHQQYISARNADHGDPENNPESDAADIARRAKPEEEGAQLLIQPDSPRNPYTPLQFSNSLGKLQAATVKAPRKIIDVGILNSDTAETAAQKDSRNFKLTLLELERLYNLLIAVEDCEKKLLALPTNTSMRVQVETERDEAVKKFGVNLTSGNRLKRYLTVRKGKTLMKRGIRLLDDLQLGLVCTTLMQHFASILRKDREEQILSEFWDHGLRKHLLAAPFELIQHYLTVIASSKSYSIKPLVTSALGSSILIAIVHRAAILSLDQNENSEEIKNLVTALAGKLAEATDLSPPLKSFNLQLPACGLAAQSLQQLERLQKLATSVQ